MSVVVEAALAAAVVKFGPVVLSALATLGVKALEAVTEELTKAGVNKAVDLLVEMSDMVAEEINEIDAQAVIEDVSSVLETVRSFVTDAVESGLKILAEFGIKYGDQIVESVADALESNQREKLDKKSGKEDRTAVVRA